MPAVEKGQQKVKEVQHSDKMKELATRVKSINVKEGLGNVKEGLKGIKLPGRGDHTQGERVDRSESAHGDRQEVTASAHSRPAYNMAADAADALAHAEEATDAPPQPPPSLQPPSSQYLAFDIDCGGFNKSGLWVNYDEMSLRLIKDNAFSFANH